MIIKNGYLYNRDYNGIMDGMGTLLNIVDTRDFGKGRTYIWYMDAQPTYTEDPKGSTYNPAIVRYTDYF